VVRVDGDGDDDGTLGCVKGLKRTVEVVRQAGGRSMLRQWRLGIVPRAVERTRSLRNRRLLDWSVMKVRLVAVVMSGAADDVSCASCFP
jgi:hypothetical protein